MVNRTPTDGLPYYCKICGVGYAGYTDCTEMDCELESDEAARSRQKQGNNAFLRIRAADLKPGDRIYMHDNSIRTVKKVFHGFGLIPKGAESLERPVQILWAEGDFSMVQRTHELLSTRD